MVKGSTVGTSGSSSIHRPAGRSSLFRRVSLAIAGAAAIGWSTGHACAVTTYSFNSFSAGTYDWSTGANWITSGTGNNFPGSDSTALDDIAGISYDAAGPTGTVIINLNNPLPAATLGGLTLSLLSGTASDSVTLNLNSTLSVTGSVSTVGGATSGNKNGKVNLNVANGATLTVGGVLSTSGSDGSGAASITINGNLTSAGTQLSDDGDTITIGASAGTISLGNFTVLRSASSSITASSAGLHLNGGAVSATGFTIGSGNSSGVAVVAGANLTISGSFIVGDPQSGTANTSRVSTMFQTSGTVTSSSGLALGAATPVMAGGNAIASAGTYNLSGGTLNIPMLQMTGSGSTSPSTNKATFTVSGNATVNIGSGGIVLGTGSAGFSVINGTIGASASWANAYTGSVALSGTDTFQAGDNSGNAYNMAFGGTLTGTGILTKTGNGSLTLSGSSNYSGGTFIHAGALYVNNPSNSGTGSGLIDVANGTLGGHGIITGSGGVDIAAGTMSRPGINNVGTLTIGELILEAGSTADFDFNSAANSMITITSALILNGGGINLYQEGTTTPFTDSGTYPLFNFTSAATVPDNYSSLQILNGQNGVTYTFGATATAITVTISGVAGGPSTWAADADGSWNTAANWSNNAIPAVGSIITFGTAITAPHTVTLDGNRTVSSLVFNSAHAYALASGTPGSTLTLDGGSGNATINDLHGSHSINAPLVLNSPTAITIANPGDSLTLLGGISGSGNLTLTGLGALVLNGSSSANILLNAGTLGGTGILTGSITPGAASHTINPGAPGSVGTLTVGGLHTNANTTLAFDLTTPSGPNDLLAVSGAITFGGGAIAVASQTSTGATSLGYYKILSYNVLTGAVATILLPTAGNVAYTLDTLHDPGFIDLHRGYIGDANDDGKVDLNDLNVILNNLGTISGSWVKGNFDGAATIDLTDLNDVLNHLGTSVAASSSIVSANAAPEPASLGLLACGVVVLIARRRKS